MLKRFLAGVVMVGLLALSQLASPVDDWSPSSGVDPIFRRGQEPVDGFAAMYCSTMHNVAADSKDTINAPEGYRIVQYDIWASHSISQVMNLKFFMDISTDSTDVDIRLWSPTGDLEENFWSWEFPVTCDRIIMSGGTFDGAWSSCVYIMYFGEGFGVAGTQHPWKRTTGL